MYFIAHNKFLAYAELNPCPLKQIFTKQTLILWASRPRRYKIVYFLNLFGYLVFQIQDRVLNLSGIVTLISTPSQVQHGTSSRIENLGFWKKMFIFIMLTPRICTSLDTPLSTWILSWQCVCEPGQIDIKKTSYLALKFALHCCQNYVFCLKFSLAKSKKNLHLTTTDYCFNKFSIFFGKWLQGSILGKYLWFWIIQFDCVGLGL